MSVQGLIRNWADNYLLISLKYWPFFYNMALKSNSICYICNIKAKNALNLITAV